MKTPVTPDSPCPHDFSGTDAPDVWQCNACPYTYREVLDPDGPVFVCPAVGEACRVRHDVLVPAESGAA